MVSPSASSIRSLARRGRACIHRRRRLSRASRLAAGRATRSARACAFRVVPGPTCPVHSAADIFLYPLQCRCLPRPCGGDEHRLAVIATNRAGPDPRATARRRLLAAADRSRSHGGGGAALLAISPDGAYLRRAASFVRAPSFRRHVASLLCTVAARVRYSWTRVRFRSRSRLALALSRARQTPAGRHQRVVRVRGGEWLEPALLWCSIAASRTISACWTTRLGGARRRRRVARVPVAPVPIVARPSTSSTCRPRTRPPRYRFISLTPTSSVTRLRRQPAQLRRYLYLDRSATSRSSTVAGLPTPAPFPSSAASQARRTPPAPARAGRAGDA